MSDSRIAVLFIISSLRFGGAEKHTVTLANQLDATRFRLGIAYLKREEHLLTELDQGRIEAWCGDFGRGWDTSGMLRLRTMILRFHPDVVVCVNTYPLFYAHLVKSLTAHRYRIVEIYHTTELPDAKSRRHQFVYRWFFNRSDRIVYVSNNQQRYWEARGIRTDRGLCIHNGIDAESFRDRYSKEEKNELRVNHGFSPHDFVVGICAALRPEKMHGDLLLGLERLKQQGRLIKVLIIGDGPERKNIENQIRALNLVRDVAITGFQSDVRPFVAACNCMTLVSTVETFSIAALESMALGKPMVMSDVGGAAEQVEHGENGFLFPRGDIELLSRAIAIFADNPNLTDRMGRKARSMVIKLFSQGYMVDRYATTIAIETDSFRLRKKIHD
ncbi:MAG: glycosyltransferase [Pseudomonadota bacterium]